jgi:hypothetical protein
MIPPESRDRLGLLAIGLLVLLGPVLILVLTLAALVFFGDLVLGRLTPVEFLELYIIELLLFTGFGYGIYRLTLWLVVHKAPALSADSDAPEDR